jgi:DNA primase
MIPKETVDRIFDTARIDEVVGEFVSLKKRGSNMIGLCPFHNEKTPSFNVSPARGIYKCFGCGKGGNSVNFIMEHEHISYPEALKWLAKKYNIEIEEEEVSTEQQERDNERESLFVVSGFAQKHYTKNLHETEEGKAIGLSYFKERGFRADIIEKFQLGYSPDTWRDLTDAAIHAGYKLEYLVKAGLTIQNEEDKEKYFDRFKGRIIFPVHNPSGRVIAFGGRTLKTDKKIAKYINSPETEIYHKSNVLYGLYFAKKQIIAEDVCYLVEGYTDVTSMHQAGIENVVASSGTSLTVEQIRLIRRYTNNITILYDGDPAGIKASFRGIDLILEEGMNVRVLLFPDNDDPDSYSKKVSSEELKEFIKENTKDFIRFKTELLSADVQGDPIKKAGLIRDIVESIALIPDAIIRSVFVKDCSRILDIEEQTLLNELNKFRQANYQKKKDGGRNKTDIPVDENFVPDGNPNAEKVNNLIRTDSNTKWQEREVVRLLLQYGNNKIPVETISESGDIESLPAPIADIILDELETDNISFVDSVFLRILNEYKELHVKNILVDTHYFIHHQDDSIRPIAIDLATSPYTVHTWEIELFLSRGDKNTMLSPSPHRLSNWESHGIYVQSEELLLKRAAIDTIRKLKLRHIELMLKEKHKELKIAEEEKKDDDVQIIMTEVKNMEDAKKHFSALLGRVVIR